MGTWAQKGLAAEHGDLGRSGLQHGAGAGSATAQAKTAVARPRGAGGAHARGCDGGSSHLAPELVEKRACRQRAMAVGEKWGEGVERGSLAGAKRAGGLCGVIIKVAAINWR